MPAQLKRRLFVFLSLVLLIALGFLAHWWFHGRFYETTDNAYVQGEITRVSSQLSARIDEVLVQDNQHVEKTNCWCAWRAKTSNWRWTAPRLPWPPAKPSACRPRRKLTQQASLIAAGQAITDCP